MSVRFDCINYLYHADGSVHLKLLNYEDSLDVIADTGCQYTTTDIYKLANIFDLKFNEFVYKYMDLFKADCVNDTVLGDGSRVKTRLVCIPNLVIKSSGLKPEKFEKFYCRVMFPTPKSSTDYSAYFESIGNTKGLNRPSLFIGNNIIKACQSFTFYENYAYMSGFDYDKYLKLSQPNNSKSVYEFYNLE